MSSAGRWMPAFDVALLAAGEKSGRLPQCFKLLADYYTEQARLLRQGISDLMYPLFLFHFAVLLGPVPALFTSGDFLAYGLTVGVVLGPLYAGVAALVLAVQGRHGERWRGWIESITHAVPLLGRARRNLALARLTAALEALINAGVPIIEAWMLAAAASGSPMLKRTVAGWRPQLETGTTPAEAILASRRFPDLFCNLYHSGEVSGKLDEQLRHLNTYYQDEGSRQMRAIAQWVPRLIYLAIVGFIAYRVVSFWAGYFNQIGQVLQ